MILNRIDLKLCCFIFLTTICLGTVILFNEFIKKNEIKNFRWSVETDMYFMSFVQIGYLLTFLCFMITTFLTNWIFSIVIPYIFFLIYLILLIFKLKQ